MFFVRRIKDRLQKFHEAGNTPNIFGRPTPRPIDEYRIICFRFTVADFLENNVVTPIVAEIINIHESPDAAFDEVFQPNILRLMDFPLINFIVGMRLAVNFVANTKLEQVRAIPVHRHLNYVV